MIVVSIFYCTKFLYSKFCHFFYRMYRSTRSGNIFLIFEMTFCYLPFYVTHVSNLFFSNKISTVKRGLPRYLNFVRVCFRICLRHSHTYTYTHRYTSWRCRISYHELLSVLVLVGSRGSLLLRRSLLLHDISMSLILVHPNDEFLN